MQKGFEYTGISVVTMCHDSNGNYLVSQRGLGCRDEHGAWEPAGGGGLHTHETLEAAAHREVKEEVGADIQKLTFLGFREVFREIDGKKSHWISFDYLAQINPEDVKNMEPDKCDELRWCTIEAIPLPQHSQFPTFLEKYKNIL